MSDTLRTRVTLKDLAKELDISQATICRALRDDQAIKEETRKKIKEAADRVGYHVKIKAAKSFSAAKISENDIGVASSPSTIYDIAIMLNISPSTVSRALNNSPQVKKQTKLDVEKIALSLNFSFNKSAQTLSSDKDLNTGKVTIYDIARKLEVSPSTVSRCLNNKAVVSPDTTCLVKKTAVDMGYTANPSATDVEEQKLSQ